MGVVREHSLRDVTCDTHYRLSASLRLSEFGDRVVAQVVEPKTGNPSSLTELTPRSPPTLHGLQKVDMPILTGRKNKVIGPRSTCLSVRHQILLFQKTEVNRLTDSLDNYGQPAEAAAQGDSNRSQEAYVIVQG